MIFKLKCREMAERQFYVIQVFSSVSDKNALSDENKKEFCLQREWHQKPCFEFAVHVERCSSFHFNHSPMFLIYVHKEAKVILVFKSFTFHLHICHFSTFFKVEIKLQYVLLSNASSKQFYS